jgi:molybdopterin synthase sulfur carrier subunit
MMKVQVAFFAELREIAGEKGKTLEFNSQPKISEVLNLLVNTYGRMFEEKIFFKGKLSEEYIFLLNGLSIRFLKGLDTPLNDGDELAILPPVAGG